MTRKDFEMIAQVLRAHHDSSGTPLSLFVDSIAEDLATELAKTNPRFNRDHFLQAAVGHVTAYIEGD